MPSMPPSAKTSARNIGGEPSYSGTTNEGEIGTAVPPWPDWSGTTTSAEANPPSASVSTNRSVSVGRGSATYPGAVGSVTRLSVPPPTRRLAWYPT